MSVNDLIKISICDVSEDFALSDTTIQESLSQSLYSIYDVVRVYLRGNKDLSGVITDENDIYTLNSLMYGITSKCSRSDLKRIENDKSDYGKCGEIDAVEGSVISGGILVPNENVFLCKLREISLESLYEAYQLSARAFNICMRAGLYTVYDVVRYSLKGYEFIRLQNAGEKTARELNAIAKSYTEQLTKIGMSAIVLDGSQHSPCPSEPIETQSRIQDRKYSNDELYNVLVRKSSTRTQNVLKDISYNDFVSDYLNAPEEELLQIHNAGKKTVLEIVSIQKKLKKSLEHGGDSELSSCAENRHVHTLLLLFPEFAENKFVIDFIIEKGHLPMLWILEHFLLLNTDNDIAGYVQKNGYASTKINCIRAAKTHGIAVKDLTVIAKSKLSKFSPSKAEQKLFGVVNKRFDVRLYVPSIWKYLIEQMQSAPVLHPDTPLINDLCEEECCSLSNVFVFGFIVRLLGSQYSEFIFPSNEYHPSRNVYLTELSLLVL